MQFIMRNKKDFIYVFIITVLILGYLYTNKTYGIGIVCVFNVVTGLYCPGCGMTRSIGSLLYLDLYQALRYNIFSIPTLIILGSFIIAKHFKKTIPNWILYVFLILLLIYGILRNIPMFSFLAPTTL